MPATLTKTFAGATHCERARAKQFARALARFPRFTPNPHQKVDYFYVRYFYVRTDVYLAGFTYVNKTKSDA